MCEARFEIIIHVFMRKDEINTLIVVRRVMIVRTEMYRWKDKDTSLNFWFYSGVPHAALGTRKVNCH